MRISSKILQPGGSWGTGWGVYFAAFRWSKPSRPYIFIKTVRSRGPSMTYRLSSSIWSSSSRIRSSLLSQWAATSSRMASPHWRFFSCFSISFKRSAASSSSMVRSALRIILNG